MVDVTDKAKKYKSVAYYPGCALEGTGNGYDVSTRAIAKKLDLKLKDVTNWNCCGATAAAKTNSNRSPHRSSGLLVIPTDRSDASSVRDASAVPI